MNRATFRPLHGPAPSRRALAVALAAAAGCTSPGPGAGPDEPPEVYAFEGRTGESSVAYEGQVLRFVLIELLGAEVEALTDEIDTAGWVPAEGEVFARLLAVYQYDAALVGSKPVPFETTPPPMQATLADLGTGKSLQGKVAGNDPVGQHEDWEASFVGWPGAASPDDLVQRWFAEIETLAIDRAAGDPALAPDGTPIPVVHVSPEGRHYPELLSKFLLGAIAYSQATDDYLDDDLPGRGILADHGALEAGEPFTALEHNWDEAFGYFGAARDYLQYAEEEIAGRGGRDGWKAGYHDTNGDGALDLAAEFNFTPAVYAAKRDLGAATMADFSGTIMGAFLRGRHLLDRTDGPLSDEQMAELRSERDLVVSTWEAATAASVIHYINETIEATEALGTPDYDFVEHAGAWSEMKGLALGLQFNPRKRISDDEFLALHEALGDRPALEAGEAAAYVADLRAARDLLAGVYGFEAADVEAW